MHFIYKITNQLDGKNYIGQTINPNYRWYQHRSYAGVTNKHKQYIHYAMSKHGIENFIFEVIATCLTQDDANETETAVIKQYDSMNNNHGYNLKCGGVNGSFSEETRQKLSKSYSKYIAEHGHPALGTKRTPEQIQNLIQARKDHPVEYTDEIRQRISDAHRGKPLSEEHRNNMVEAIKKAKTEKAEARYISEDIKCSVDGCKIKGKAKYRLIDDIRYCAKHGLKMQRNGNLDPKPKSKYNKDNPMPEEQRKKCGVGNIGRVAHNRIVFSDEQIKTILVDSRSARKIAKAFGVTEKVILRIWAGKY
jgi:group I intron endonuclease